MKYWIQTVITTRAIQLIELVAPIERPWASRLLEALRVWAQYEIDIQNIARSEDDQL